ncbi:hypothetical protein QO010_003360 [Caulobacter ginsengisoli]|uniref:DUF4760 domain-containing protein n=1 Tax=Caulobacter ginsengisoli TaxID=400775 RepID=A0ABU0IW48_9CAUL|nr:hypothetical protein [Caulobacter ginsengisoli]MDQ0465571.1 hypothetical protein [Caulobacter ginsengisoli]
MADSTIKALTLLIQGAWATAALIAAATSVFALFWFQRRQIALTRSQHLADWEERLRATYRSFWVDEKLVEVRYWIVSDTGYAEIRPILQRRLETVENVLGQKDNQKLDLLDRFFAIIFSTDLMGASNLSDEQDVRIRRLYGYYWVIIERSRPELLEYANRFWFTSLKSQKIETLALEETNPDL